MTYVEEELLPPSTIVMDGSYASCAIPPSDSTVREHCCMENDIPGWHCGKTEQCVTKKRGGH